MNLDTWNGLTEQQRAKLAEGAAWMEELNNDNADRNASEYAAQAEAGIETITFSEADAETWIAAARDAGWAAVEEVDADLAQQMRACMTK